MKNVASRTLAMLTLIITILIAIGTIYIYAASSVFSLEKFGSAHYFVSKQLLGIVLGVTALIFFRSIPLHVLKKLSGLFFLATLGFTVLTLVPGMSTAIHGSRRWLSLGGILVQPSEMLKIGLLLFLARSIERKQFNVKNFWKSYAPLLIIIGISAAILLKQPDFGLTVTLTTTTLILLFIAECSMRHLLLTAGSLIPVVALLIIVAPYRVQRVLTFLDPWSDPKGRGFQIIQSLISIGSGHWFGMGIGQSKQKFFYLPMQHTDFIFSIIAEETGFIGVSIIITLYVLLLFYGVRCAWQLKDTFSIFFVLGFVILTTLQALINMYVATGLLPTKGIGLPFISYGNSALVANLAMLGIVMNCVRAEKNSW